MDQSKSIYFAVSHSSREWTTSEKAFIIKVLNDARAWPYAWTESHDERNASWSVSLETPDFIHAILNDKPRNRASGPLQNGLSVTLMRTRPRRTYFSFQNWTHVPAALPDYNRTEYRTYLVLHECGHALGLGHARCRGTGPAPIMHQQTRGNKDCAKNIWPLAFELRLLS